MKKFVTTLAAILIIATSANAQTGNIVTMKRANENATSMTVKYTGSGTITANGVNLNNGSSTTGITPNSADSTITITTTGDIQLTYLTVFNRNLTKLNVSQAVYLDTLYCYLNQLDTLDVSKNTALTYLSCYSNQLDTLDVSKNTALTYLSCYSNQLEALDVSKNTDLTELRCYSNQLEALDLSKNTALTYLSCYSNQLEALDLSKNTALTYLSCYSNQLDTLDVSKNTGLTSLYCYSNQLSALDVSKNTALRTLYCYSNQLSALDVSKNTALTRLDCYSNQLSALDVSKNTDLAILYCYSNQLSALDVSKNTALTDLRCYSNQLTALDISKNTLLTTLLAQGQQIDVPILAEATTFSNPIYYHNKTDVEAVMISGTPYAYEASIPLIPLPAAPQDTLQFTTSKTISSGNPFGGVLTFVPGVEVTFNSNGGTYIAPRAVKPGKAIGAIANPTLAGYTFAGWYQDNNTFLNKWDIETYIVSTTMTLHAKWTEGGTGIVETQGIASSVQVYPNPAQGTLYIQSAETVEQVIIYDISGRALLQIANPNQSIDISHFANGIYLIKVKTVIGETTKKIVKQ